MSIAEQSCWIITEGHAGMQNQCLGVADALGVKPVIKRVITRFPWTRMPALVWPNPLSMAAPETPMTPPWPSLVIACGRRSIASALAIKRAAGKDTFVVYTQDPHINPKRFDLVIVPEHDECRGENVMTVRGALHHVTRQKLARAAEQFAPQFASLRRPLITVLIGGSNRRQKISPSVIHDLADKLIAAAKTAGATLAVTPSRRTGAENIAILRERLKETPSYMWDFQGDNPYFGLLALGDAIVVTADSVSMTSEACFTGKPVHVFELEGGSSRLRYFHSSMQQAGFTRPFRGVFEKWTYVPLEETKRAAAEIRRRLEASATYGSPPRPWNEAASAKMAS